MKIQKKINSNYIKISSKIQKIINKMKKIIFFNKIGQYPLLRIKINKKNSK